MVDASCAICYVTYMARGTSGRIVVEVDPDLKSDLYVELARRGLTLKAWFIEQAEACIREGQQPNLFAAESAAPPYASPSEKDS